MPKKDGFYVLEQINEHPGWGKIPVVVLSNIGDLHKEKALALGAIEFLEKTEQPMNKVVELVQKYVPLTN
jgi:CheY-like chemotaxis protein